MKWKRAKAIISKSKDVQKELKNNEIQYTAIEEKITAKNKRQLVGQEKEK